VWAATVADGDGFGVVTTRAAVDVAVVTGADVAGVEVAGADVAGAEVLGGDAGTSLDAAELPGGVAEAAARWWWPASQAAVSTTMTSAAAAGAMPRGVVTTATGWSGRPREPS
jgi:hypothetical protein